MMKALRWLFLASSALLVAGCGGQSGKADLDQYMKEMRAKPSGKIEPLPEFKPYEAFSYKASGMRSPFEPPVVLKATNREINSDVKPDLNREKEPSGAVRHRVHCFGGFNQ